MASRLLLMGHYTKTLCFGEQKLYLRQRKSQADKLENSSKPNSYFRTEQVRVEQRRGREQCAIRFIKMTWNEKTSKQNRVEIKYK